MSTNKLRSLSLLSLFSLWACGGARHDATAIADLGAAPSSSAKTAGDASASPASATAPAGPTSYAEVFTAVAARVEKSHTFSPGRREFWDAHKEELRREMASATTREEALVALAHAERALGDRHCGVSPPTDLERMHLSLGVDVFASRVAGKPVVRVSEVTDPELSAKVAVGDEIVAVDGVPMDAYLEGHPFASNALNPSAALEESAASAVQQTAPWTTVKEGDTRTLRLSRGERSFEATLTFRKPYRFAKAKRHVTADDAPDMAKISCTQEKNPPYAGYAVASIGANVCVYRPTGRSAKPPIVRFLSFYYSSEARDGDATLRGIRADHDLLKAALARDERVVVDLRDNHGGNNPFIFVSWFAHAPWGHEQVRVRVSDDFAEDEVREFLWGDDDLIASYQKALGEKRAELTYPFLCKHGTCETEGPRPSELVAKNPVALITGTECTSSCDSLAALWSEFHLGPVVGKQPMHGFTTVRYAFPVTAPDHRDMGKFRIALSWEGFAGKPSLEGRPIHLDWEAKDTFETRETWIDLAIDEAAKLLSRWR